MGLARRYILEVDEDIPSGITRVQRTVEYDLREAFSGTGFNGKEVTYSGVTTDQIGQLSDNEYRARVDDFLYIINIETEGGFQELSSTSVFNTNSCDSSTTNNDNGGEIPI